MQNILSNISEIVKKRSITGILLIFCFGGTYLHSPTLFAILLGITLYIILYTEAPKLITCSGFLGNFLLILYPIIPFASLIGLTIRFYETDIYLPLYPFLIAWTADTCGYIMGKLFGYHKIYPSISPGKSWEGLCGSILGVLIMHYFLLQKIAHFSQSIIATSIIAMFMLSVIMTLIAFAGGFFLSLLKRRHHLKDAGSLLPGHGGLLDRFDGVLFVSLATWILIVAIG